MWKRSIGIRSLCNDDGDLNENGKKAIGLDWQDNNFARVSRFFCTFLCRHCTTTMWTVLIPPFLEYVNTRPRLSFSFPELRYNLLEFNSRNYCRHLTDWTRRNKRYLVWGSLNSPFKWRFHSRRRRCFLSSLLISWTPPPPPSKKQTLGCSQCKDILIICLRMLTINCQNWSARSVQS